MSLTTQPTLQLTEKAASQVAALVGPDRATRGLRIFIDAGGCSGLSYGMELSTGQEGDEASEQFGVRVFVDEMAQSYLKGSVIDYSDSLTSTGFQILNPNARSTCGCGKSFEA